MLLQYVIFPHEFPPHEVPPHEVPLHEVPPHEVPPLEVPPLQTELWVEPQYGSICGTPPGLEYLRGLQHEEISEKVHACLCYEPVTVVVHYQPSSRCFSPTVCLSCCLSMQIHEVDAALVTSIASFFHLHHCCESASPLRDTPSVSPEECYISFQLPSLLGKSQLLAFTLTAFSEGDLCL